MTNPLERVLERLEGVRPSGDEWTARCPAHEDRHNSLAVGEGADGRVLLYCHAGCPFAAIVAALGTELADLFPDGPADGRMEIVAAYPYVEEAGGLLYEVVRLWPKDFRQRRPDGRGGWIWNLKGTRRVLYRLPQLIEAVGRGDTIYVAEGEKDVHALEAAGAVATCNPMGAGKWHSEYNKTLHDADVVIVADKDETGRAHAQEVAASLEGVASSVQIVEAAEGKDAADHLAAGLGVDEFVRLELFNECTSQQDSENAGGQKEHLVGLLTGLDLFTDQRDTPYAELVSDSVRELHPVGSKKVREWLGHEYYKETRKVATSSGVSDALNTAAGIAKFKGKSRTLHNRVAISDDGSILYDLADSSGRVVHVTPDGWNILDDYAPTSFYRYSHQAPQVEPERGGDLSDFLRLVNLKRDEDRVLLLIALVVALVPDIPRTLLGLHGPQGAAKTSLLKMMRRLLDPSIIEVLTCPREPAQLAQACYHHGVVFFDNLSKLTSWQSDMLCRVITGDGMTKRALYTDEDDVVFQYKRFVSVTGINAVTERPDLLDRSILMELGRIPATERREEGELWRDFEALRPRLFGAMLTALSGAMRIYPEMKLQHLNRMADWERWGAAAAEAIGIGAETFRRAYSASLKRQNDEALDANPIGRAVLALMRDQELWEGSPATLLAALNARADADGISRDHPSWPKDERWVFKRLREVEANLIDAGVKLWKTRPKGTVVHLRRIEAAENVADDAANAESKETQRSSEPQQFRNTRNSETDAEPTRSSNSSVENEFRNSRNTRNGSPTPQFSQVKIREREQLTHRGVEATDEIGELQESDEIAELEAELDAALDSESEADTAP